MWHTIRLSGGEYDFDDASPLGRAGGFGEVFLGRQGNAQIAVKRLLLRADTAAHRELDVAAWLKERRMSHVVQVIDAGQDAETGRYFVAMPLCEGNLQEEIGRSNGGLSEPVVCEILSDIVAGLIEVETLVHRDLKPANILRHEGVWKIADFGIAKFVEDATSLQTVRDALTPEYAAPEQWLGERPSHATDVYALGCIFHALVTGRPPFQGEHLREAHIELRPPNLDGVRAELSAFYQHMLRKVPAGRPTLVRCAQMFSKKPVTETTGGRSALADAARHVAEQRAHEEAELAARKAKEEERAGLYREAAATLQALLEKLMSQVAEVSNDVRLGNLAIEFGRARFSLRKRVDRLLGHWGGRPLVRKAIETLGWDLIAYADLSLEQTEPSGIPRVRSALLLFGDAHDGQGYRWYEVAFYRVTMDDRPGQDAPFAAEVHDAETFIALRGKGMASIAPAYGPIPIDGEDEQKFINRWSEWIAAAAIGSLARPPMPMRNVT